MHKKVAPEPVRAPSTQRESRLASCLTKIHTALRHGRDAFREIGRQLIIIQEEELWRDTGAESFTQFVLEELDWNQGTVSRTMTSARIMDSLEKANLRLPANETQAYALHPLEPEDQLRVWQRITEVSDSKDARITAQTVRFAVEQELGEKDDTSTEGVNIDMGPDDAQVPEDQKKHFINEIAQRSHNGPQE